MRSLRISPITKWTLATGITFLFFMIILRFIFFELFKPTGYSLTTVLDAFFLGVRYDLRTVSCIVLPLLLVGNLHLTYNSKKISAASIARVIITILLATGIILFLKNNKAGSGVILFVMLLFAIILLWLFWAKNCNPFKNKAVRKVWMVYFLLAIIGLTFFYAIDIQHYDYLHQRLNASILNYAQDAKTSAGMVWQTYPVIKISMLILAAILILYWLINRWYKTINSQRQLKSHPVYSIILFIFLGIAIFGRIGQYPLRWSDAFAFGDEFKSNISLNPVQSFFSTLAYRNSGFDIKMVREYYPLMASYLGVPNPDSIKLNYTRSYTYNNSNTAKPNVVLVVCESFSAYKSSMWGNPLNTTPFFNTLCTQGIFFDHCFTPAYGTARGVWATITGIPDVESPNTASRNPAAVNQHTIINEIEGYKKFYFLGGSTSWANIRGLLTNNITGLKLYEEGSYKAKAVDVWGISDKHLFLEANDVLRKQNEPFFAIIQTSDNHRPYTIPAEDLSEFSKKQFPADTLKKYGFTSNEELNAFRYTDFCYQKFIEASQKEKYFNNTIFIFVGDHGISGDASNIFPKCWTTAGVTTQHVPLLFYAPDLLTPQRISKTCSQIDILPSAAALLKVNNHNTTLGRNLFDTSQIPSTPFINRAFLYSPEEKNIGIMTDDYCYIKNLITHKEDFLSSKNNEPLPGSSIKDKILLRQLTNAYFETAKYMLLNNKKEIKQ